MAAIATIGIVTVAMSSNLVVYQKLARPIKYLIVRAQVIKVQYRNATSANATLKIIHVFSSDQRLVGTTFQDSYKAADLRGRAASKSFKVGEQGLWSVDASASRTIVVNGLPFRCRSRPGYDSRHEMHIRLAGTIEQLLSTQVMKRSSYAQKLVFDPVPEVSHWFARYSCSLTPTGDLIRLTSPAYQFKRVPYSSQIVIDEALVSRMPHDWPVSAERKGMLEAWVSCRLDEYCAHLVLNRLDLAVQSGQLPVTDAVYLVKKSASNKNWPWSVRRNAVFLVGRLTQGDFDNGSGFRWLVNQIESNDDVEMRRASALAIRNFVTLYPERLKTVHQLLDKEKDLNVAEWLREASSKNK